MQCFSGNEEHFSLCENQFRLLCLSSVCLSGSDKKYRIMSFEAFLKIMTGCIRIQIRIFPKETQLFHFGNQFCVATLLRVFLDF